MLKVENIHKYFGKGDSKVHALKGISLSFEPSKVYTLAGPSGSGKSTLLYLLGLLDMPDQGTIWIDNQLISAAKESMITEIRNRLIGYIFQYHFLIREFTAIENIMLPMKKLGKLNNNEIRDQAFHLLEQVGLENKANRLSTQLSGGEQQRVAIARALANKPKYLVADEPTGSLDQKNTEKIFDLLYALSSNSETTLIMVTHDVGLAKRGDKCFVLQDGLLLD